MKILSIAGRNLNSLRTEFKIDFTTGSLKDCGIFAITGPTGAGKTTLLDTLTLALYGRTPRSASDEDIISYGTGEAWAEVVFETAEGKFKSEWKVRRARHRHDGAIQQSTMEVSNYPDGKILTQKKREAQDKVKDLIKLEYDQFLKSVLLAQGAFKAFLDAKEGERGEMLEKISDTSLYTKLSKRAFERKRKEEQLLENLQASIGNVILLSEEERAASAEGITNLQSGLINQQKELELHQVKSGWLQTIRELTTKHENAFYEVEQSRLRLEVEQPNLQGWEAHLQVVQLEPEWVQYLGKTNEYLLQQQNIQLLQDKFSDLTTKDKQAEAAHEVAHDLASKAIKLKEEKMPAIIEAMTRQKDLLSIKKDLDSIKQRQQAKLKEEAGCRNKIAGNESAIIRNKEMVDNLTNWIAKYQHYAEAGAGFTKASLLVNQLQRSLEDIKSIESILTNNSKQISFSGEVLLKTELIEKEALREQQFYKEQRDKTTIQLGELRSQLMLQSSECLLFSESTTALLEERQNELSRQQFLAEHLSILHEGEPCPLCGASDHPNKSLTISEVAITIISIKSLLEKYQAGLAKNTMQHKVLEKLLSNLDDFEGSSSDSNNPLTDTAENIFNELMMLWKSLPKKENDSLLKLASARQQKESLTEKMEVLKTSNQQMAIKLQEAHEIMSEQLKKLDQIARENFLEFDQKSAATFPLTLKAYSEEYQKKNMEKSVITGTIPGLQASVETLNEQVKGLQNDIANLKIEIAEKNAIIERYNMEINAAHLGFASPEEFRDRLNKAERDTYERAKEALNHLNTIRQQTGKMQGELDNATTTLIGLKKTSGSLKSSLEAGLKDLGWEPDTELIRTKLLLGKERETLGKLYKNLNESHTFSIAQLNACKNDLDKQLALAITDESAEIVAAKIISLRDVIRDMNIELGRLQQVLREDDQKKARIKTVKQEIDSQEMVFRKWASLSGLIGSADGKKFNQFAQGLTLDRLISVSNHHLQLLNDRYRLKRNTTEQGLRLLIVDQYQADNEREINTLSGGESFLVSLALALGLSEMTSKLTTIDSLFIDEGFGTLDSDTLEVALNALRGLQIGGKTIGIISHVERLKEEIYTQVEITKAADGFSSVRVIP